MVILAACAATASAAAANPVTDENALPGDARWNLAEPPAGTYEGYASETSLQPGDTLHLHVEAPGAHRIEIYRVGWYAGAGGRRVACLPSCTTSEPAVAQPAPPPPDPTTGIVDAGWSVTDSIPVATTWTSGYYFAIVRATDGTYVNKGYRIPFIVREPSWRTAPIVVQASTNTWQAYNDWGGKSLYGFNSTDKKAADHVSFDRPYDHAQGNASPLSHEIQLVRFLEREGFDVAYQDDQDTDASAASLLAPSLVIVNGHGEYWTKGERDAFDAARDAGQDLIFAGADIGFWQVRYEDGGSTLVGYKAANDPIADPALKTKAFRFLSPPRPECQLLGVQYALDRDDSQRQIKAPYTVFADPMSTPWLSGTGLVQGQQLPGLVNYEWDSEIPGCATPPLDRIFYYGGSPTASTVTYTLNGATVQSWGSLFFKFALDGYKAPKDVPVQPGVQAYERNVIAALGAPGDATRPHTTITSQPGTTAASSGSFAFTSSSPGATFACSLDGAAFAACSSPATYTGIAPGVHAFRVRATAGGTTEDPPASASWTVCSISGTAGDDSLVGTAGNDVICGFGGNDTLNGKGGDDLLIGGDGNDQLVGGTGADELVGGDGTDTASYSDHTATQPVVVTLGDESTRNNGGDVDGPAGARDLIHADVENALGGKGDDTLTGSAGSNLLTGGDGVDTLSGMAGSDRLMLKDSTADTAASCGDGNDTAVLDAADPAPSPDCEKLTVG